MTLLQVPRLFVSAGIAESLALFAAERPGPPVTEMYGTPFSYAEPPPFELDTLFPLMFHGVEIQQLRTFSPSFERTRRSADVPRGGDILPAFLTLHRPALHLFFL